MRTVQTKCGGRPYKRKIETNRNSTNKSVRRKEVVYDVELSQDQYENVLVMLRRNKNNSHRIRNLYKTNISDSFFQKLLKNKIPRYSQWYK